MFMILLSYEPNITTLLALGPGMDAVVIYRC
jgi:hypothetical protein